MNKGHIKSEKDVLQQCHTGDRAETAAAIRDIKMGSEFYMDSAQYLSERTEDVLVLSLTDAVKFFIAGADYVPKIVKAASAKDALSATEEVFGDLRGVSIPISTSDRTFSTDSLGKAAVVLTKLFVLPITLGIPESETDIFRDAGVAIIGQLSVSDGNLVVVEAGRGGQDTFLGRLESVREDILLWAAKAITPRTVSVAAVAASVALNLLASPGASANMTDVKEYFGSRDFAGVMETIKHDLNRIDGINSEIRLVENTSNGSPQSGTGHFKIVVGDCFVVGDYHRLDGNGFMSQSVNVHSGYPKHTTPACRDVAEVLVRAITGKIDKLLDRK
jgi:hypothetical protein